MLEPNKDKLFKIGFEDEYEGYIKEMIVGYKWLTYNLDTDTEEDCFKLGVNAYIDTIIDFNDDESVPCKITRIS